MKRKIIFSIFFATSIFLISNHACAMEEPSLQKLKARNEHLEQQLKTLTERYLEFLLVIQKKLVKFTELLEQKLSPHDVGIQCDMLPNYLQERNRTIQTTEGPNIGQAKIPLTVTLIWMCQDHLLAMNSLPATISSILAYELLLNKNKRLHTSLPVLSHAFQQRLTRALKGGLYASLVNALLETALQTHSINGWKVIGVYVLIDLISTYGWDAIKKLKSKPVENTVKKKPSKLITTLDWGIKTLLAETIARVLTCHQPLQMIPLE